MSLNVEKGKRKRIVIVGGGFGGLQVANGLKGTDYQVILIDKNNYHQFPPLIYQVASAGMEAFSKPQSERWSTIIWCSLLELQPIFLEIKMLKKRLCP